MSQPLKKDNLIFGKIPPQAPELEEAVIGAILIEREALDLILEIIKTEDVFYVDAHQKIYKAILHLRNSHLPVDLLTITDALRRTGELDIVGGVLALTMLTDKVTHTSHIETHARIVYEKFIQRELIRIAGATINAAYEDSGDCFEIMDNLTAELKAIESGLGADTTVSIGASFTEMLAGIEIQQETKSDLIGISTGFPELDRVTLGWIKSDLIILAARPSQGKTAFAVNFADTAATNGSDVLVFSLESSDISLTRRIAAACAGISLEKIRTGNISNEQKKQLYDLQAHFRKLPIKFDPSSRTLDKIKSAAKRWNKKRNKSKDGLIIVDYLQLMSIKGKGNREQEIATISRVLKELAMELDVAIIALSQLNREVDKRTGKKPELADLRESGAIEQDANIVLLIWWEDVNGQKELKLIVAKNRDGKCGEVKLKFDGDIQKIYAFEEIQYSSKLAPPSFVGYQQNFYEPKKENIDWDN